MIYSLARPSLFHTQRNNEIDPASTCNVTAMVNALLCTGIEIHAPKEVQPEDHLARFLAGDEAKDFLAKNYPALAGHKPREVHAVLSWAVNTFLVGRKVTVFSSSVHLSEILFRLVHQKAAACVSGTFTPKGHVVALVGFETGQDDIEQMTNPGSVDLGQVRKILVNDSWGDWHAAYKLAASGYEVAFTMAEFQGLVREVGSPYKWAHLFDRDGEF